MSVKPSAGVPSGLTWVKSSYSGADGPDCVEVAAAVSTVHVRDSKNAGPAARLHARGVGGLCDVRVRELNSEDVCAPSPVDPRSGRAAVRRS